MKAAILGKCEDLTSVELPLFLDPVRAGFPSPAEDYVERTLDLNKLCIKHPAATYLVRAEGDSMTGVGIYNGDVLVVDRSLEATQGDVIIAAVNGEFTVKILEKKPKVRLLPANDDYEPIELEDGSALDVFGVVTNVIHSLRRR